MASVAGQHVVVAAAAAVHVAGLALAAEEHFAAAAVAE